MRIDVRLPALEGVAPGQTATCRLPVGRRYHELSLLYAGVTLAQMNEIRVMANGKPIHRYSGADLAVMNLFDGRDATPGVLIIPFDRYNLKSRAAEEETAVNTAQADANGLSINLLGVEIDIDAAAAAPVLSLYASQNTPMPGGPGTVRHIQRFYYPANGAGEYEIADLPRGQPTSLAINRIFFKSAEITRVVVERDQFVIFDRTKTLNDAIHLDGVREPQAGWFVWDRTEKGFGGDVFDLVNPVIRDLRFRLTLANPDPTLSLYVEYLGTLGT